MTGERAKRKLTAILSADVKGYSRLMADNEEATVRAINDYREVMTGLISEHHGRVMDARGDNVLAEFPSVVDAVRCSVDIQKELKTRNADLPEHRKMEFRIGVNLGDVIEEKETIYGDGVNVAARLEGLADAGGLCISGTAFDQVRDKLNLGYEYLGEQSVKNIPRPIRTYKVLMESEHAAQVIGEAKPKVTPWRWASAAIAFVILAMGVFAFWHFYFRPDVEPASLDKMAYPLPDRPSIAVLPFDNMTGDPDQEYFSDGITEEIITALSRIPYLFVIARNSTFTYKGKSVKIKRVAEEFGVRYVLEGSVRKSEDRVRITAQLIDAFEGRHLWAERYDRNLKDIFAIQDEITMKIITALQVKLKGGDAERLYAKGTDNLEAYLKSLQSRELSFGAVTKDKIVLARRLAEDAIALDPNYSEAYRALAHTCPIEVWLGMSKSPRKTLKRGVELAQKVIALDNSNAHAHSILAIIYVMQRQHNKAVAAVERAYALEPNSFEVLTSYAWVLYYVGMWEEALRLYEEAMRLSPIPDNVSLRFYGATLRELERYDEAIAVFKRAIKQDPRNPFAHLMLAVTYSLAGRDEKARSSANDVLRINPKISIRHLKKTTPFKNPAHLERIFSAMRKAGIPETPPLPLPDKPSIAVLPFVNMSGDQEQEYFSDGISEEIITALSKSSKLFVIARESSFSYKGKQLNVPQIARELGVRYILEGSVRKSEDRVRITGQLIDGTKGQHLWSERYERDLKEIFALQDEITMEIVRALRIKLADGEQARMWDRKHENLDAFLKSMEAQSLWNKGTREGYIRHGQVAKEIINMAPESAVGYRLLGLNHWYFARIGKSPRENILKAFKLAKKALSLDESHPVSHALLGNVYLVMRQYEKAIAAGERSIELDPNGAMYHALLGMTLNYAGRPDEAIAYLKQGIRLNPFPAFWYFSHLGLCYMQKGEYRAALTEHKKALHRSPDAPMTHLRLAITYILLEQQDEARTEIKKLFKINPNFSIERLSKKAILCKNPAFKKLIVEALRTAASLK